MKKRVSLETAIMLVDNGIFIKSDRIYLKGLLEDNITFNPLVNYEYYYAPTHEELVDYFRDELNIDIHIHRIIPITNEYSYCIYHPNLVLGGYTKVNGKKITSHGEAFKLGIDRAIEIYEYLNNHPLG